MSDRDFTPVRKAIRDVLPKPEYDDGSAGPVLVRLAWHCSGTYDVATNTGGSNGATMRYAVEANDPANNGLQNARKFLESVKEAFPWISYGDLWTLAGVEAIAAMGGPEIPWKGGRLDHTDDSDVPPNGRLPDAAQGQDHIRNIFYRMGFNDQEIVALSGAHNLGRCHGQNSGFEGPWVPSPTKFGNTYYKLLVNAEWTKKTNAFGQLQFRDEDDELMMLPTDMALIADPIFRKYVEAYAKDKELFYRDFSAAFAKLIELGVQRDASGNVMKKGMQQDKGVWVSGEDRDVTRRPEISSRL